MTYSFRNPSLRRNLQRERNNSKAWSPRASPKWFQTSEIQSTIKLIFFLCQVRPVPSITNFSARHIPHKITNFKAWKTSSTWTTLLTWSLSNQKTCIVGSVLSFGNQSSESIPRSLEGCKQVPEYSKKSCWSFPYLTTILQSVPFELLFNIYPSSIMRLRRRFPSNSLSSQVWKALSQFILRMSGFCVLFTFGFTCCADESLHTDLTLNGHCLLVGLQLAPLSAFQLLSVPLPGHFGFLPISASHDETDMDRNTNLNQAQTPHSLLCRTG